jgi:NtrC-family two-component system sensor histidine kinase KinB
MSVRSVLIASLLVFVFALVLLGAWSAWRLRELGGASRRIIADNYDSVVAAQNMKESLERQDSAALFILLGEEQRGRAQLTTHRTRFDQSFARAAGNITEPGEREVIDDVRRLRDEYYARFDRLFSGPRAAPAREYFAELEPLFDRLRSRIDDLLRLNQEAMRAKSRAAEAVAQRWFLGTLILAATLVTASVLLASVLAQRIVRPLEVLTAATDRMSKGDLDVSAPVRPTPSEIAVLATSFNRMADHLRELRRSDLGRLRAAQQLAESAIDSLYDPVLVTDAQGWVTRLNRAAEEIFGSEGSALGQPVASLAAGTGVGSAVSQAIESGRPTTTEAAATLAPFKTTGTSREFRVRTTPMRDEGGTLLGSVTLLEDVTHLRELDRVKSEFIATASHELRTPLASALMGIHLLLEPGSGALSDRQRDLLEMCRDDCNRLDRLMRELLDLSRLESGRQPPVLQAVPIGELLQGATSALRAQVEAKGIAFNVRVDPAAFPVLADPHHIERVLANLVGNALRATESGGTITVQADAASGHAVITVRDTGRGIPAEHLPRLFQKFSHVPGGSSGGAGLGLSIAKQIVEAHGGRIWVQSTPNRGTVFSFTLPTAQDSGRTAGSQV